MEYESPLIVGIGGTTRVGSTSEQALRLALRLAEQQGARTRLLAGDAIDLRAYDPGRADRTPAERHLVETLRAADGIVIASPGYHGSISGMLKNAIDYTEDLRADARPYFEGRAVGCIVCAAGPQAMGSTLSAMRSIVHALRGWPTPFGAIVNTGEKLKVFDASGNALDAAVEEQIQITVSQVVSFARRHSCQVV